MLEVSTLFSDVKTTQEIRDIWKSNLDLDEFLKCILGRGPEISTDVVENMYDLSYVHTPY